MGAGGRKGRENCGRGLVIKYKDMPILNTTTRPIICMLTFKIN